MLSEQIKQRKLIRKKKERKRLMKHKVSLMTKHGINIGSDLYSKSRKEHTDAIQRRRIINQIS